MTTRWRTLFARIQHLVPAPPIAIVATIGWVWSLMTPLQSGAWLPVAVAPLMERHHSLRLTSDALSPLSIHGGSWHVIAWVTALAGHAAFLLGGSAGLSCLGAFASAATALFIYLTAARIVPTIPAMLTAVGALVMLMPIAFRGQLVADLACAVLVWQLVSGSWSLAPLTLVAWANLHPSAEVGTALCVAAACGVFGGVPDRWSSPGRRLQWMGLALAAPLVTPMGPGFIRYTLDIMSTPDIGAATGSWQALSVADPRIALAGIWLLASLAGVRALCTSTRAWLARAMLVGLFVASILAARHGTWLAIVGAPFVATSIRSLFEQEGWPVTLGRRVSSMCLLVCAAALLGTVPGTAIQQHMATGSLPKRIARDIPSGAVVLANLDIADWLVVQRRDLRVVLDVRFERYSHAAISQYVDIDPRGSLSALDHLAWCNGATDPGSGTAYAIFRTSSAVVMNAQKRSTPSGWSPSHEDHGWTMLARPCGD